jgi:hypothetical protein
LSKSALVGIDILDAVTRADAPDEGVATVSLDAFVVIGARIVTAISRVLALPFLATAAMVARPTTSYARGGIGSA